MYFEGQTLIYILKGMYDSSQPGNVCKVKNLDTALHVWYGSDTSLFQYDYASAKEKYYGILNKYAQVTGKLALAGNHRLSRAYDPYRPGCGT